MFKIIVFIFFLCGINSSLISQDYRAGDITYKWLYGYTYEIKYTTYTTNGPGTYQCSIDTACLGDGTHGLIFRSNGAAILCSPPARDGVAISSSIKLSEYVTTHTFGGSGNYNICFEQANRNAGIINILGSENKTMSFESFLTIPPFFTANSSPTFANIPIAYGCLSASCFTYNPMASDSNGDSLAYSIVPYMISGASLPSGGVGGSFIMNPVSGTLTWCNPQLAGDYNVRIKIEEWRKDLSGVSTLIGYVYRDTQFIISNCTSIKENSLNENLFSVYPNPINNEFELVCNTNNKEDYVFDITDISGRQLNFLIEKKLTEQTESYIFKIENLTNGIYFLKITGNSNTNITKKIIKQ